MNDLRCRVPWPFRFPAKGCAPRRHAPIGYTDYRAYKDWLRDEFDFRCLYCLTRERWERDPRASFSVEHLIPRSVRQHRTLDYGNLGYACTTCNSARRDCHLPFDPNEVSIGAHLRLDATGTYQAQTAAGQMLVELLALNVQNLVAHRRIVLYAYSRVVGESPGVQGIDFDFFRYPNDLPDLEQCKPPGGNERVVGLKETAFARRARRILPDYY